VPEFENHNQFPIFPSSFLKVLAKISILYSRITFLKIAFYF